MKSSLTISTAAHALLLAWGLISFSAKPFEATAEALPVDVISSSEFSQITAGVKTAPKAEVQKPLVEKVAPETTPPPKDLTAKVSDKKEIEASREDTPPPQPQVKEEPKQKPEEKKPDEIAEALKKEQVKPPPTPPKKPPPPKVDLSKMIENKLALLDKRDQRRQAVTADAPINNTPTLGTSTGRAASLSQSEIDALRAQIQQCWNPPAGAAEAKNLIVKVRLMLNQDGTLSGEPQVVNGGGDGFFQIAAESATRAIRRCQPYKLPIAKYEVWKDVEVTFDPRDMYRG